MTGLMRSGAVGVLLLLGLSGSAGAFDAAPDTYQQQLSKYDPVSVAAAEHYAQTFNLKETFAKSIPLMRTALAREVKAKNPALDDAKVNEFIDRFLNAALVDNAPLLEEMDILIILETFSKEELVAVDQFYSSPIGRSIMKKVPVLLGRMPEITTLVRTQIMPRALQAAVAKMKSKGVDVHI